MHRESHVILELTAKDTAHVWISCACAYRLLYL